jgi:hypothetical protein
MVHQADISPQRYKDAPGSSPAESQMQIIEDLTQYLQRYARERPQTAALVCLGIGFILGWKLKPW